MDIIGAQYHVLTVLVNTPTAQGAGNKDGYSTLLTTRCSLRDGSGSRSNSFSVIEGGISWEIVTRYQDALWSAIAMSMKFQIDGITYTLQAWERIQDKRKSYIKFRVSKNA